MNLPKPTKENYSFFTASDKQCNRFASEGWNVGFKVPSCTKQNPESSRLGLSPCGNPTGWGGGQSYIKKMYGKLGGSTPCWSSFLYDIRGPPTPSQTRSEHTFFSSMLALARFLYENRGGILQAQIHYTGDHRSSGICQAWPGLTVFSPGKYRDKN